MPDDNKRVIIDVHTHIFNAWDIPLKGYLKTRREYSLIEHFVLGLVSKPLLWCLRGKRPPETSPSPGLRENFACWMIRRVTPKSYLRWAHVLAMNVKDIADRLRHSYKTYDLSVPLMVDYEYWFASTRDIEIDRQVESVYRNAILLSEGHLHPFISFCPARQLAFEKEWLNPDGNREHVDNLQLIEDAVTKWGFIGVKLYNSVGYRPLNNAAVDAERRRIALHKNRYRSLTGEDYDRTLHRLYKLCEDKGIPITTHCQPTGIEGCKGASDTFGAARHWQPVLEQYPKLHLNLAHFGWYQHKKEGYNSDRSWAKDICSMMESHQNLYADIAHHDLVECAAKERFVADYKQMFDEHPIVKQRLLFGTDWHVFVRRKRHEDMHFDFEDTLRKMRNVSESEMNDLFGGNAMRFLGLRPGEPNHIRLKEFYARESIAPPSWFPNA